MTSNTLMVTLWEKTQLWLALNYLLYVLCECLSYFMNLKIKEYSKQVGCRARRRTISTMQIITADRVKSNITFTSESTILCTISAHFHSRFSTRSPSQNRESLSKPWAESHSVWSWNRREILPKFAFTQQKDFKIPPIVSVFINTFCEIYKLPA